MPSYHYKCPNSHFFHYHCGIYKHKNKRKCPECGKMGAQVLEVPQLSGEFSQKTKDLLSVPFGRKKAQNFKKAKDVDAALADFQRRYPTLGQDPGRAEYD